ncbi:MAG: VOC family protein [Actinoallomurus sp.]
MDIRIHSAFLPHDDPDASLAFYRDTLGFEVRNDVGYGGMRWITVGPPASPARRFPGFPFVFEPDNPNHPGVDTTHDVRSDHDRRFHPGNQDRAASRVRPGQGQGGVCRPARRSAADRRVLLRRI